MVKLVDVAREAGTSVATVSRALNNNERVDPALAERVRAAAAKLGYRPNFVARNLRRQSTKLWLLIISDIEIAFFTSVARGVEDTALKHGYAVVLCNADEDDHKEARYVDLAVAEQAAGVIISPHSDHTHIERLIDAGIPVVLIDRGLDEPVDSVTADSRGGAQAATEHLLQQGWERPACITGPQSAQTAVQRRLGYEDALKSASIKTRRVVHRPFTIEGGRTATAGLLDRNRPPDSLFVANAALTLGVLQELQTRGLRPGTDIGLVCFDDAPWAPFIDPPISVVSQPAYRMGTQAAGLLVERISGGRDAPPRRIVLGTDLIVRSSSLHPAR
ncbi:LacI family DNA-binding transcriptional regulator [Desertimonas flava]|uniref:LacI family DNA-binding transcriptional regulator n=1 Tax=Desertimonas flava TaxID=2064846 RepID=UPI000E35263C|nr:LacI family DNA-binding transcriptional regulator [Desertimonas flava]